MGAGLESWFLNLYFKYLQQTGEIGVTTVTDHPHMTTDPQENLEIDPQENLETDPQKNLETDPGENLETDP